MTNATQHMDIVHVHLAGDESTLESRIMDRVLKSCAYVTVRDGQWVYNDTLRLHVRIPLGSGSSCAEVEILGVEDAHGGLMFLSHVEERILLYHFAYSWYCDAVVFFDMETSLLAEPRPLL